MSDMVADAAVSGSQVIDLLQRYRDGVSECSVAELSEQDLRAVTTSIRALQRSLDALLIRVAARASDLAGEDRCGLAQATLIGTGDVSGHTSRRELERANIATDMPALGQALANCAIGGEHLDAVSRACKGLDDEEKQRLVERAGELATEAERLPVDTFARRVNREIADLRNDHGLKQAEQQRAASELRYWTGPDGMGHLRGSLDPARFTQLTTAIEGQMATMAAASDGKVTLNANLAAAALVDVVTNGGPRSGRPSISLIVDGKTAASGAHRGTICETTAGVTLPAETAARFACDAEIRRVLIDERGLPLDVGRRYRTATDAQWAALKAIHATCGWKGCGRSVDWCQAHHIRFYEEGGLTDLPNLIPLCSTHHHAVHEGGWGIELTIDRTLRICRPDGTWWADARPDRLAGRPPVGDPADDDPP